MRKMRRGSTPLTAAALLACGLWLAACEDAYVAPWPQSNLEAQDYDESLPAGPLRLKAEAYDAWHLQWHQPDYGGTVNVRFTDDTRTQVAGYGGWGDSTIWTGTYLASQALRYYVTGSPEARANALRMVDTLIGHLHVTGARGFIARYWGPQTSLIYQGDEWCDAQERCFRVEEGPFAGDFWWGSTSRDQYIGWFFGMVMAYDLVDDEAMRVRIRSAVVEVLHAAIDAGWQIIAEDGEPSDTAPDLLPTIQLAFSSIGYHVAGDYKVRRELQKLLLDTTRKLHEISNFNAMNRYAQYYGNNLGHTNWYTILRLGRVYFGEDDLDWLTALFNTVQHSFTRLSHNAWFNQVYMSQGGWVSSGRADPYTAQLLEDLTAFRPAPNEDYHLPDRDPATYTVDPVSVELVALYEEFPWLADLMGSVHVQALEAFPVPLQCSTDFLWQRNPFNIDACGSDDPRLTHPGVDYLLAYWLASYHKYVTKDL